MRGFHRLGQFVFAGGRKDAPPPPRTGDSA